MNKIHKAVIPAAGFGTRFLPATKAIAKEMIPIIDKPTIEYIVREAMDSGIEDILIIVSSNKNSIMDYFDNNFELETQLKNKGKFKFARRLARYRRSGGTFPCVFGFCGCSISSQ